MRLKNMIQNMRLKNMIQNININEAYANGADKPLSIPTYVDGNGENVHPSVYHNSFGWNGHKYWMVITPFAESNDQVENPSIVVSDNGKTWTVPQGISNPIVPAPDGGYNSDPHICMSPDGKTMNIVYRTYLHAGTEHLYVVSSNDGINWSEKKEILTTDSIKERNLSPAVIWNGQEYLMWTVDIVPVPNVLKLRKAQSITNTFGKVQTCNITLPKSATGQEIWHIDVIKLDRYYFLLANTTDLGFCGSKGSLYLAKSMDGINWSVGENPVLNRRPEGWDANLYRGCILPKFTEKGLTFSLWYSAYNLPTPGWATGYTEIMFNK